MTPGRKWKVCVRCYTYNQKNYIADALNGFVMQHTDFPYVCCVVDDASTDGEQEVIEEYIRDNFDLNDKHYFCKKIVKGKVIFARHKKNINCYFAAVLLSENHNGSPEKKARKRSLIAEWERTSEYEALCEGDDYWTDSLKLQRQVDFLETHPDYGMCYTQVKNYHQDSGKFGKIWGGPNETFESLYLKNTVPTLSVVYRFQLDTDYKQIIQPYSRNWKMGDYPLWLFLASVSRIKFMDFVSGVYRRLGESASHSRSLTAVYGFRQNFYDIGEEMRVRMKKDVGPDIKHAQQHARYTEILPIASLLNDEVVLKEAEEFYKGNKTGLKEYIILNFPSLTRVLLRKLFKKKGYRL